MSVNKKKLWLIWILNFIFKYNTTSYNLICFEKGEKIKQTELFKKNENNNRQVWVSLLYFN